jgi:hypothetical protein
MAVSETDLRRSNRLQGRALCKRWWNAVVDWTYIRQQSWLLIAVTRDGRVQKKMRTFGGTTREWVSLRE